jgi:hypothetical protein
MAYYKATKAPTRECETHPGKRGGVTGKDAPRVQAIVFTVGLIAFTGRPLRFEPATKARGAICVSLIRRDALSEEQQTNTINYKDRGYQGETYEAAARPQSMQPATAGDDPNPYRVYGSIIVTDFVE